MPSPGRRLGRADKVALGFLVLLPTAVAVIPTIAGRPLMGGDNVTQNYPLRVLVGDAIRHGHLPLWDPYLWSGTPLLAGWNAGAAFPGSWLFAVLPASVAWTLNLVAVGVLASVGMYWFLRRQAIRPAAAFLGALSFTFTGFLAAQNVHIGLVLGTALLPWICLGIDGLARRQQGEAWISWTLLTAASLALTVLSGDPRAVSNDVAVAALLALAWCWRRPSAALRLAALLAIAGALAVTLAAVQWLPGLQFLHQSERGTSSFALYSAGSLAPTWGVFALVPYLLGGNGNLGLPLYSGPLNWPEIGMSVGILPLVAVLALPAMRARRRPRSPAAAEGHRVLVWYLAAAGGIILAMGSKTPLGHLLWHLPLFGAERLQNRNIGITDFAILVLFALWVDEILGRVDAKGGDVVDPVAAGRWSPRHRDILTSVIGALPGLAAIAAIALFAADPVAVERHLSAVAIVPGLARQLWPYLVVAGALAALVATFAVVHRRLSQPARLVTVVTLSCAEALLFALNAGYAAPPRQMLATTNSQIAALRHLATPAGRYALYDPDFYVSPGSSPIDQELGFFDLGIVHGISSVQGYGSVVAGSYEQLTATHQVGNLDLAGVKGSLFDILDLKVLLTSPLYLAHPLEASAAIPSASVAGPRFVRLPGEHVVAGERPASGGPYLIGGGASAQWFLPAPASAPTVTIVLDPSVEARPSSLVVGFVSLDGATQWVPATVHGEVAEAAAPVSKGVIELRILDAASYANRHAPGVPVAHLGAIVVQSPSIGRQLLDGPLQGALDAPHWTYAGQIGQLPAFVNHDTRGLAWAIAAGDNNPASPTPQGAHVSTPPPAEGASLVSTVVTDRPALLVSSIAWAPGWEAEIRRGGPTGAMTKVATIEAGPVVAVAVQAGRSVVTWVYRPRRAVLGAEITAAGVIAAAALALSGAFVSRRRRSPKPGAHPVGTLPRHDTGPAPTS